MADMGEELWARIEAAEDSGGLNTEEARGDLSKSQFQRAKTWIKDVKCALARKAFVRFEGQYLTTVDPDVCASVVIREFKVIEQRVTRIYHGMIEPLPAEAQSTAAMGLLKAQCLQIISGMKLLKEAGYSSDAAVRLAQSTNGGGQRKRTRS
ncbi:hypothetical protein [Streptomyces sp. NPDC102360]|uniref:hypothetical protein n=1 Tax=Streptomyces sp. NPDC102360 TaxID=3366160 RepID=UPI003801E587